MIVVCIVSGSSAHISLALDSKCILGESPVWDAKLRRLHFVDINGKKLHSYDPASEKCSTVQVLATYPLPFLRFATENHIRLTRRGGDGMGISEPKQNTRLI